jgi:hypothetical protein
MDEARVRLLLEQAAGTEAPPSRVDVERARNQGRWRLRWRRAGLAGSSVMAVVAVLVVALAASGSGPFGAGPGGGNAPATYGQVPAPRQFSLLSSYAAFGWLPAGESLIGGTAVPTSVYLTAGDGSVAWALTVYVVGSCDLSSEQVLRQLSEHQQPQLMCATSASGTGYPVASEAPPVDGHTAFWTTGDTYLVWQYGAGAWAALWPPQGAASGVLIKVADNVTYGAASPQIKFPVQLTGMPAAWQLGYVQFAAGAGGVLRASQYTLTGAGTSVPPPLFDTGLARAGSSCSVGKPAPGTINGYRVTVCNAPASNGNPPVQQVCAADADGLTVFVSTYGRPTSFDAVSIFTSHLRILGTNPANWTTQPLG